MTENKQTIEELEAQINKKNEQQAFVVFGILAVLSFLQIIYMLMYGPYFFESDTEFVVKLVVFALYVAVPAAGLFVAKQRGKNYIVWLIMLVLGVIVAALDVVAAMQIKAFVADVIAAHGDPGMGVMFGIDKVEAELGFTTIFVSWREMLLSLVNGVLAIVSIAVKK